ncbi:hypothetical protein C4M96_00505 [Mycoplasmopsis pullorum]|uniref:hypothetical protein n=1 Tax=Mycoplasmopsis pullorum TaxID=48003 RepID=UPI0015D57DA1|nr:hypothetical protein [Mycoplasmopsis pullorum]TNK92517.1 hypothetical protein C4M96_00505 [Mycoplasmopsis pullorum]
MKIGNVLEGIVTKINFKFIEVTVADEWIFTINVQNVSDWYRTINLFKTFTLNQKINFITKSFDLKTKTGEGDFKANHPNFARNPFSHQLKETEHGFANLKQHAIEEFENKNEH